MPNRIKELRKVKGLRQEDLAKRINVSINTVRRWESGTREPRGKDILALESIFETSVDYLLGESDIIPPMSKRRTATRMIYVPVVSRERVANCDEEVSFADITSEPEEFIPCVRDDLKTYDELRPPFAFNVEGDCLESINLRDGDKAIINPAEVPSQGTVASVRYYGMLSLKYIYKLKNKDVILQSDNTQIRLTPDEQEAGDFVVIGAVVGSFRPRPPAKPLFIAK